MRYSEIIAESSHPFRKVVAHLTTETTGGDVELLVLRENVKAFLQGLRGKSFLNIETEHHIVVTIKSIKKTTSVGSILLRIHYALPQILENGTFLSVDPARSNRPGMIEMLNLGASVMFDDQLYHVVAKIRRYPQGNQHYSMHFDGEISVLGGAPPALNPAGGRI